MRLFIAINFNDDTINKLLALRNDIRENSTSGNFSLPENLHLTLAFLGECSGQETDNAKTAMNMIRFSPFPITIERVGRFRRDDGDLWWAGVKENNALQAMQRAIVNELELIGFSLEKRKYSPHITLGRKVATTASPNKITPFGETVASFELMKSERIAGKLTYTAIHTVTST